MKYRLIVFVVITVAWTSAALSQARRAPARPAAPPPPVEEPPPVMNVPKDYKYDARGRRDPFVNPVPRVTAPAPAAARRNVPPAVRPPGLKGVLVAEAGIAGVVTSKEPSMNVVIINAPAGRTYFARIGDELFDAVVKEIRLDTVTFALNSPGSGTESTPREIVRKVRPTPGE